jgi:hypothetical protein
MGIDNPLPFCLSHPLLADPGAVENAVENGGIPSQVVTSEKLIGSSVRPYKKGLDIRPFSVDFSCP